MRRSPEYVLTCLDSLNKGEYLKKESVSLIVVNRNLPPVIELPEERDFVLYTKPSLFIGLFCASCFERQALILDAKGTLDPNNDDLKYTWDIVSQPEGSSLRTEDIQGRDFAFATNKISDVQYYLFFAGCMFLTAVFFIPYARRYRGRTYIQPSQSHEDMLEKQI